MPITHIASSGDLIGTTVRDLKDFSDTPYVYSRQQIKLINDLVDTLKWSPREATDSVRKVIQNGDPIELAPRGQD